MHKCTCMLYTGTYSKNLHKMVYLQNRRYLQENDKLRYSEIIQK